MRGSVAAAQNGDVKWLTRDEEEARPTGRARWLRPSGPVPRPSRLELLFDLILAFCIALPMKPERAYTFTIPGYEHATVLKSTMIFVAFLVLVSLSIRRRFPLVGLGLLLVGLTFFATPFLMVGAAV